MGSIFVLLESYQIEGKLTNDPYLRKFKVLIMITGDTQNIWLKNSTAA